jgi:hypothetical protein
LPPLPRRPHPRSVDASCCVGAPTLGGGGARRRHPQGIVGSGTLSIRSGSADNSSRCRVAAAPFGTDWPAGRRHSQRDSVTSRSPAAPPSPCWRKAQRECAHPAAGERGRDLRGGTGGDGCRSGFRAGEESKRRGVEESGRQRLIAVRSTHLPGVGKAAARWAGLRVFHRERGRGHSRDVVGGEALCREWLSPGCEEWLSPPEAGRHGGRQRRPSHRGVDPASLAQCRRATQDLRESRSPPKSA